MPQVVPIEGVPFAAELVAATVDRQLIFRAPGQRKMAVSEIVRWGHCPEPGQQTVIALLDSGLLVADVITIDKDRLTAESETLGEVQLPLDVLAGIIFRPPWELMRRDSLLERVLSAREESDRLLLRNGDELNGLLESLEHGKLKLRTAVGFLDFKTEDAIAIVFNPALRRKLDKGKQFQMWAGLTDGSRLLAERLMLNEERMTVETLGQRLTGRPQGLVFLQPMSGDRVVYLSDLQPDEYRHTPLLELSRPYQRDRNVAGGLLRCGKKLYLKGLGVHAAARLVYALSKTNAKRFEALIGIDDSTDGGGSVQFRVLVDGQEKYASPTVRGGEPPLPVSVDVSGGKRLELLVDYGEQGDVLDRADWLEARLTK